MHWLGSDGNVQVDVPPNPAPTSSVTFYQTTNTPDFHFLKARFSQIYAAAFASLCSSSFV
jgi:hypothetical protein